jgi:tetratricopeptide (TPR) repeat protein
MKIRCLLIVSLSFVVSSLHAQNAPEQLLEAGKKALATQQYQAALVEFQSAATKADKAPTKLEANLLISETAALLKDSKLSQEAMQKALQILEKDLKNDCQYLKKVNLKYGEQLYQQADYSKSIEVGQAGLDCLLGKAMNSMEDTLLIADYYYNLGIYYSLTNDLDKSLSYSLNALDWHRRMDNREALSDIYHNMGNLFYKNGRYKEALDFILQGRDIQATIVGGEALDKYFINCNAHVASTYRLLGKPDSAFFYINKSISIHRNNPFREDETYKVFAQLYLEKGDLKEAESYARQSLTAARKAGDNGLSLHFSRIA